MSEWLSTHQAAMQLGISASLLLRLRSEGFFKIKTHYRKKNPRSARPTYIWHIDRCGDALGYEPKIRHN